MTQSTDEAVLAALGVDPLSEEQISTRTGLPFADVALALGGLLNAGKARLHQEPGHYGWSLARYVHSYDNDFPADALPRGRFEGSWSGCYVVLDGTRAHVPTDEPVLGTVRVVLHVTDQTVGVEVVGLRSTLVQGRDLIYRPCQCGETAHRSEVVLVGGKPAGFLYKCRNCQNPYAMWRRSVADSAATR